MYITAYWFMHTLHVVLTTHGNNYKIVLIYPILFIYLIYNYVIHMSSVLCCMDGAVCPSVPITHTCSDYMHWSSAAHMHVIATIHGLTCTTWKWRHYLYLTVTITCFSVLTTKVKYCWIITNWRCHVHYQHLQEENEYGQNDNMQHTNTCTVCSLSFQTYLQIYHLMCMYNTKGSAVHTLHVLQIPSQV